MLWSCNAAVGNLRPNAMSPAAGCFSAFSCAALAACSHTSLHHTAALPDGLTEPLGSFTFGSSGLRRDEAGSHHFTITTGNTTAGPGLRPMSAEVRLPHANDIEVLQPPPTSLFTKYILRPSVHVCLGLCMLVALQDSWHGLPP